MNKPGVLITNSRPPMQHEIAKWQKRGFIVYYQPLLSIEHLPILPLPENTQAIVLTSANAAECLSNSNWDRNIPVYGVGVATVSAAKLSGFKNCSSPNATPYPSANNLISWLKKNLQPQDGIIVHGSGEILRYDITDELKNYGFQTLRVVLYKTVKITYFQNAIVEALRNELIQIVTIASQQAIETFATYCKNENINAQKISLSVPSYYLKRVATNYGFSVTD